MDVDERKISKLYRKILTSNEMTSLMTFQRLDKDTQEKVKEKMIENGSKTARRILTRIEYLNEIKH